MKCGDQTVRRAARLMNLPTYELDLDLEPRKGTVMNCPAEVQSLIGRIYRMLDVPQLHREGALCHIVLPLQLHELLVPLQGQYLLLGPFLLEGIRQEEFELMLLSIGLQVNPSTLQYFQTLNYMSPERFEELSLFFSELLDTPVRTESFLSGESRSTLMQSLLLSSEEEENRESAVRYYTDCARAFSFRQTDQLRVCAKKWESYLENAPTSAYPYLKEMIYNEYILLCSTYHEAAHFRAAPFIAYLRQKLNACASSAELADFHREMLSAFSRRLDAEDPLRLPGNVREVRRYIRTHYRENLKLSVLSDLAGLSPAYLSALFLRCCGESITDYILFCRLEQARRLLLYSALPVGDIAGLCGFSEAGYFCKCFRRAEHMTPGAYRKHHGQREPAAPAQREEEDETEAHKKA